MNSPQVMSGHIAQQYKDSVLDAFKAGGGAARNQPAVAAFREADLANNAAANAGNAGAMLDANSTPLAAMYKALGPEADSVLARMQGNPDLMAAITGGQQETQLPALLAALQQKMGAAQGPANPMLGNLATMGLGGAAGGRMGTQAISGARQF